MNGAAKGPPPIVLVVGVSGSGKPTVGTAVAEGGACLVDVVLAQQAGGRALEGGQVQSAVAGEVGGFQADHGSVLFLSDEHQVEDPNEAAVHQIDQ
ncbi:adenylylsulfate kinase-like enzyme [Streptomyces umbrinus]|uniref:Adenylylsulfate kinase-like enzyme n=1 Tax=Streptomyces umbrinus TaxID=67370 RepID=A0ABU0T1C6_9ACTN|nr:adenylylsulfate kinase-like enzyme [Streptomyces umbrinus]